tara:strand:+ start:201 stop:542 length:342 start_codon:yes stop_codon:yes gene_type:complete
MAHTKPVKKIELSLNSLLRPGWDPTIGEKYTGNHTMFRVDYLRDGDEIIVEKHEIHGVNNWDTTAHRETLQEVTERIEKLVEELNADSRSKSYHEAVIIDDIPQGFSFPSSKI